MKVSVSLPSSDVAFLDEYAREHRIDSRSQALHKAVEVLRSLSLGRAYEDAWNEWFESEDAVLWERTTGDGLAS